MVGSGTRVMGGVPGCGLWWYPVVGVRVVVTVVDTVVLPWRIQWLPWWNSGVAVVCRGGTVVWQWCTVVDNPLRYGDIPGMTLQPAPLR